MTRWRFHALAPLVASAITFTPGEAAAQDCLAYLAADVAFDNVHADALAVSTTIRAAIEAQDAAAVRAIETRDAGKWKDYVEARRQTGSPFAARAAAFDEWQRRADAAQVFRRALIAVLSRDGLGSAYDAAVAASDEAAARADDAYATLDSARAAADAVGDRADAAYLDVWLPAARVQLMAAYAEAYAAAGRDVEGYDIGIVFAAAAAERQDACPAVGHPELLEPLEILARY